MAAAGIIASAIGTVISAVGAFTQGKQNQQADAFNAQVQQNNATAANAQGLQLATQDARQKALLAGTIEANAGASGGTGAGSALDVLGDTSRQEVLQQKTDEYNAALKGMGYTNSATVDLTAASNAGQSGILNAAGALGSGAARTAQLYNQYTNPTGAGTSLTPMG